MSENIIVIGGGISGTAAAYEMARRGARVTLLERGDLASMASGWTLAGVRQSGRHPAELPLAEAAVARWHTLDAELGAETGYRQQGNLRLALTPDEVPTIEQVVRNGTAAGIAMEFIDAARGVREIAPAITDAVCAASWCPTDGHANPVETVLAFAAAARRAGATIVTGCEVQAITTAGDRVTGVETSQGTWGADAVAVAAGVYTPRLLAPLGLHLPLTVTHVPVVQTVPAPHALDQVIGVADGHFAGRQELSGRYRLTVGSTPWGEPGPHTADTVMPTMAQVEDTIASSRRILPGLADIRIGRVWGGLIDRTPDVLPVIERSPAIAGLLIAAGFSGHGFCLGPVTGGILADLALTGETALPIAPFTLGRFADQPQQAASLQMHG